MATGRALDHIVLAVHDLDTAAARYEALGFTLTPRAQHEDRMGTSNRIAQFAGQNFIELLEVDRPDLLAPHDPGQAFFGFGAQNKAFLRTAEGISMLVFTTDDARADIAAFEAAGVDTYAPFDFQRQAKLPDGSEATVAFSLAFATSPDMPDIAIFACENRAPDLFWKPAFQNHGNGALGIGSVTLASPDPARDAAFFGRLYGGDVTSMPGGFRVACGASQAVHVVSDDALPAVARPVARPSGPYFAGITLRASAAHPVIPACEAHGIFITFETN